jgi:hypothetical protein
MSKVVDIEERIIKKLYIRDLLRSLDLYTTNKHMEAINNPYLSIRKNDLSDLLEAHGKQIMGKLKNELDENDPAEILRQILASNSNEYIDDNFEIYQRDQDELDKELVEKDNE